jgi:hypothetical protein
VSVGQCKTISKVFFYCGLINVNQIILRYGIVDFMQHRMDNIATRLCVLMLEENGIGCCDANIEVVGRVILGFDIEGWGLERLNLMEVIIRP